MIYPADVIINGERIDGDEIVLALLIVLLAVCIYAVWQRTPK